MERAAKWLVWVIVGLSFLIGMTFDRWILPHPDERCIGSCRGAGYTAGEANKEDYGAYVGCSCWNELQPTKHSSRSPEGFFK